VSEYDVIIVGLGAMGSAAAWHLAQRGQRLLGLDTYRPGHTFGSSHGETRIIRMAYFEHSAYVPLVRRAWQLWRQLERDGQVSLLEQTGGLFVGPPSGALVAGSLHSARLHDLPHEMLDAAQMHRRFPGLRPRDGEAGLFEEQAGMLRSERCIETCLRLAADLGADLRFESPVEAWSAEGGEVVVQTASDTFRAATLVVTAGAWAGRLLSQARLPLQPERMPVFWYTPRARPELFDMDHLPIWIWQDPVYGEFFGTPHLDWPGVKAGKHHTGQDADPETVDRQIHAADEAPVRGFLERCMPDLAGRVEASRVCLYTNTPDTHFIVDRLPEAQNVVYAAGFSGHGFKFASVIGEILADLTLSGTATSDADFLRLTPQRYPSVA
jgi:sarcosine oxidase